MYISSTLCRKKRTNFETNSITQNCKYQL